MSKIERNIKYIGISILSIGILVLILTYRSVIISNISYLFSNKEANTDVKVAQNNEEITKSITNNTKEIFVDKDFGIYIPKIRTNAKIIANVDAYDQNIYLKALKEGVAHASGSSLPNQNGNVFLFAHSAVNFYEQNDYSVYFYLIDKLESGDLIYITYKGKIYRYSVIEKNIVSRTETKYLGKYREEDTLTLMTCWPNGTNWKRIVVTAARVIQ